MADVFTTAKRSEVMSRIRGKNNMSTELRLIEIMRAGRILGWRRNQKLPGKPDFVFRSERLAIFVDGCFWHSCPKCSNRPANNAEFWKMKLDSNRLRDRRVKRELIEKNWKIVRFWEHELVQDRRVAKKLMRALGRTVISHD